LPMAMVDSGNKFSNGVVVYQDKFATMVDSALARPPQAEVQAFWVRLNNTVRFSVKVKNLTGSPIVSNNHAAVNAIVYEEAVGGALTNRYVRAAVETSITSLASNATATFELDTPDLSGANWNKLHYIALVDYQPNPSSSEKYDMLQAAVAVPSSQVKPDQLTFLVDNSDATVPSQFAQVEGASNLTWNASESASWLTVTATGTPSTPVQFSVSKASLVDGWQQAVVTFSSTDGALSDQVTVKAYLGDLARVFLPLTRK
jgi:hypothetical protein